jgi:hypothetical protein
MLKRFHTVSLLAMLVFCVSIPVFAMSTEANAAENLAATPTPQPDSEYAKVREEIDEFFVQRYREYNSGATIIEHGWINAYQYSMYIYVDSYTGYTQTILYTCIPVDNETFDWYKEYTIVYPEYSKTSKDCDKGNNSAFCDIGNGTEVCAFCGYVKDSYDFSQHEPPFDPADTDTVAEYTVTPSVTPAPAQDAESVSSDAENLICATQEFLNQYAGKKNPFQFGFEWCAAFIGKCADAANIPTSVIPRSNSCTDIFSQIIKQGGQIVTTPMAGDLIFYKSRNTSDAYAHIGIMISETVSVQGNIRNQIMQVDKPTYFKYGDPQERATTSEIVYVRPDYN